MQREIFFVSEQKEIKLEAEGNKWFDSNDHNGTSFIILKGLFNCQLLDNLIILYNFRNWIRFQVDQKLLKTKLSKLLLFAKTVESKIKNFYCILTCYFFVGFKIEIFCLPGWVFNQLDAQFCLCIR